MGLNMFCFIDDAARYLESMKDELDIASKDIELYFEDVLQSFEEGYLNISSRVKSAVSLKEKIIRNNYYKKYKSPEELIPNLSDLIGIRIECRFIQDEAEIYKFLKKAFNKVHSNGYYYNNLNKCIGLDLKGKQPQKQKNGFEIYRIDGVYEHNDNTFNFELQIKSLVNVFWSEIEHKVIYKNNNYMLADKFIKSIIWSIKGNLSMMDNQLMLIYDNVNKLNTVNPAVRKVKMEALLSKVLYDAFASRMKESIGFLADFKKSSNAVIRYIFRKSDNEDEDEDGYNRTFLKALYRITEISKNEINFNSELKLERNALFEDEFSTIVGNTILSIINEDFQWNLFFRMMFEMEPGNNAEDFENFIKFLRDGFYKNESFSKLYARFGDKADNIKNQIIINLAYTIRDISSIDFVYDNVIDRINEIISNIIDLICKNIESYESWESSKGTYFEILNSKVASIFK